MQESRNKKPVCVISTDWHIKRNNHMLISKMIDQQIEEAKLLNISLHIIAGDIFDTRESQPLKNLLFFELLINKFIAEDQFVLMIPGNHDKVNQEAYESYLNVYRDKKAFHIIEEPTAIDIGKIKFNFLPYFKEQMYLKELKELRLSNVYKNVLITHTAFNGSVNNDGSSIENKISLKAFKEFDLVLSGHYHNKQSLTKKIHHIPSLYPGNFGENNEKGLTILYDDLSFEIKTLAFPLYETIKVDIDILKRKDLLNLIEEYSSSDNNVRFHIIGERTRVDAFDYSILKNAGIAYKVDRTIELQDVEESSVMMKGDNIIEMYEKFAEDQTLKVKENTIKILEEVFHD